MIYFFIVPLIQVCLACTISYYINYHFIKTLTKMLLKDTTTEQNIPVHLLPRINYKENYNNKLNCIYYTSIRLESEHWEINRSYLVNLKGQKHHIATIESIVKMRLEDLTDYLTFPDCALPACRTIQFMQNLYPKEDFTKKHIYLITFKKVRY